MKRILCYGDSNTWGESGTETRIDDAKQWPVILQRLLGDNYRVVQEGLSGRMAGDTDLAEPYRHGQSSFEVAYRSASPVDLVIIALGSNDLQQRFNRTVDNIIQDLQWYQTFVDELPGVTEDKNPKLLYLAPSNFVPSDGYFEADPDMWRELIIRMKQFDAPIIELNDMELCEEGVHYTEQDHQTVANRVRQQVEEMLA